MSWEKGQSGNPNGRKKKSETATDIIAYLLKVRDEVDPLDPTKKTSRKKRLFYELYVAAKTGDSSCMKLLLEYGYGRPKYVHEMDANVNVREAPKIEIVNEVSKVMFDDVGVVDGVLDTSEDSVPPTTE